MGNYSYSDDLLGKTVEEATEFIKANKVYYRKTNFDNTFTDYLIGELRIYVFNSVSTCDYKSNRLSIEIDPARMITKIRGIG